MVKIPNARVRIIRNENNDLVGVFFQDERMAHFYDKYPEIIFFDATHKLNNLDMPLFIQLCVDDNGETEIISLYVCTSESREGVGSMIDEFKRLNPSYIKTKVILGDKDFVDRLVYLETFENALWRSAYFTYKEHFVGKSQLTKEVWKLSSFSFFEIRRTSSFIYFRGQPFKVKIVYLLGITNAQREAILAVLQCLVYSTSEEIYNSIYDEFLNLNLEKVTDYYNSNWHCIRNEWTLFGINEH